FVPAEWFPSPFNFFLLTFSKKGGDVNPLAENFSTADFIFSKKVYNKIRLIQSVWIFQKKIK
ncbi:TPA: hypothetical protein DCL22_03405, partial [Candidatus Moranbacteria bacterium]|nr:hypothetical protein [Candidatus Moranbacteria bacterium]